METSSRLGALLTILCSRTKLHSIPSAPSTTRTLQRQLRLLYLSEAQLHMTNVRLPLPEDAVVPSDVELRTDSMAQEHLMDERQAHERTRERVKQAQIALEKATTAQVAARNRAEKSEGEAKSLRGEVSKLRGEKDELKLQVKEVYAAKHETEKEVEKLKDEVERYKREAQGARGIFTSCRLASQVPPARLLTAVVFNRSSRHTHTLASSCVWMHSCAASPSLTSTLST